MLLFRKGHLPSDGVPLASLCLHRSRNSSEGNTLSKCLKESCVSHPSPCSGQCRSTSCTSTSKIFLFTWISAGPLQRIGEIFFLLFLGSQTKLDLLFLPSGAPILTLSLYFMKNWVTTLNLTVGVP